MQLDELKLWNLYSTYRIIKKIPKTIYYRISNSKDKLPLPPWRRGTTFTVIVTVADSIPAQGTEFISFW